LQEEGWLVGIRARRDLLGLGLSGTVPGDEV
jgi:hypothetical protein